MPEITLSGYQPTLDPISVDADDTIVNVSEGAVIGRPNNSSFGIWAGDVSDTTFNILGSVYGARASTLDTFHEYGARYYVGSTGTVDAGSVGSAAIEASYDVQIHNEGRITALRGFGVEVVDPIGGTIVNDGLISGVPGGAIFVSWDEISSATLVNRGTVRSTNGFDGVFGQSRGEAVWSSAELTTIYNSGEILGLRDNASAVTVDDRDMHDATVTALITNSGTIQPTDLWGIDLSGMDGSSTVINSGVITGGTGAMLGSAGADLVTNRGTITGDVRLGGGNDIFRGAEGRHAGVLDGGAGDDRLDGGLSSDVIRGGGGNDMLSGNGGTDRLDGGSGTDTILYLENMTTVRVDSPRGGSAFQARPGRRRGSRRSKTPRPAMATTS